MNKKTTRTRAEAKKLMWEYYRDNKSTLPTSVRKYRREILDMLMIGDSIQSAFSIAHGPDV
jgi:hypothetical protein